MFNKLRLARAIIGFLASIGLLVYSIITKCDVIFPIICGLSALINLLSIAMCFCRRVETKNDIQGPSYHAYEPEAPKRELDSNDIAYVKELILQGQNVKAIKYVRDTTNMGLYEAKTLVDGMK